ncbi:hypothetical protein MAPG_01440 [Magnaporthiopsis poae ATCC 64411]|uniref:Uncharacterized protein n=1 Tax=Magnaporthiopsis poae (strain ATCC 64411 / 73-15) TaxID=644358 RepID=A0A0C4DNP6_MAGP6|nr:hypothetical protein MAPG_01440 [Magnaporthiopsis poae ATCC 64411]
MAICASFAELRALLTTAESIHAYIAPLTKQGEKYAYTAKGLTSRVTSPLVTGAGSCMDGVIGNGRAAGILLPGQSNKVALVDLNANWAREAKRMMPQCKA